MSILADRVADTEYRHCTGCRNVMEREDVRCTASGSRLDLNSANQPQRTEACLRGNWKEIKE